ncbi:MAG TPA: hypothetical protein VMG10_17970 [Gemmataceae bacterium]|nr:hypothetical protein [Gemmataceae bacterium]
MKKRATARRLLEIEHVLGCSHLITVTAGPSFDLILLSLEQSPDYRLVTGHGSFAKKRAASPNRFRVHYQSGDDWLSLDLAETLENYHAVQPLSNGRWLLVRCRAAGDQDANAHIYDADGIRTQSFPAGDGIADVQATERGNIWVSYFDEGVFGDTELSRSGLVCLGQDGRSAFRLGDLAEPVLRSMADCYALNVCSDREVWLYFYTDFPLVRLMNRKVAGHWMMPVAGSHAFAVDRERVLLGGSYDRKESLFLGWLDKLDFEEVTPVDENEQPLRKFRAFGRRHHLYLQTEDAIHLVDMHSL